MNANGKTKASKRPLTRIDRKIRETFSTLTKRQAIEALEIGLVSGPRGKKLPKGMRVPSDFPIDYTKLELHLAKLKLGNADLKMSLLYQNEEYLVIDKPSGIPTVPINLSDTNTVTHWALANFPDIRDSYSHLVQPEICPHRLDTDTSGLVLIARSPQVYLQWRERFHQKQVQKHYLAWCEGVAARSQFEIRTEIAHHSSEKAKMVCVYDNTRYRAPKLKAQTTVQILQQLQDRFLCHINCQTGVTHQIRVHLASIGHPLIGDRLYGAKINSTRSHQLRAVKLRHENTTFELDSSSFSQLWN